MRRKIDKALISRMKDIRTRERIGWVDFRKRFFRCPWCTAMMWKVIRFGSCSMVFCLYCKRPHTAWQVISFWERREQQLRDRQRAKLFKEDKRDNGISNHGLPTYRFKNDEPDD